MEDPDKIHDYLPSCYIFTITPPIHEYKLQNLALPIHVIYFTEYRNAFERFWNFFWSNSFVFPSDNEIQFWNEANKRPSKML